MKTFMEKMTDLLADAALLEMGVDGVSNLDQAKKSGCGDPGRRYLIEVAYAEAADYDDIHQAILREHRREHRIQKESVRPDDCHYGDNDDASALCSSDPHTDSVEH